MGLPLFTRDIKGKAVERGPEYGSRTTSGEGSEVLGDETEDLYMLVKTIKVCIIQHHPQTKKIIVEKDGADGRKHIRNVRL